MVTEYIKSLFTTEESDNKKDIALIVNGLVTKLSIQDQSELIYQMMQHRNRNIKEVSKNLKDLEEDKNNLKIKIQELDLIL